LVADGDALAFDFGEGEGLPAALAKFTLWFRARIKDNAMALEATLEAILICQL
jgi:hypothetical protein